MNSDKVSVETTMAFCQSQGLYEEKRFQAEIRGRVRTCVFSRIGGTGRLICHEEGEPDMQSSWAWTPETFLEKSLD